MQPPKRWTNVLLGLALGYTRGEIAAGLDESTPMVSATVNDLQDQVEEYDDPSEFFSEILGADVEFTLDLDAIEAYRNED